MPIVAYADPWGKGLGEQGAIMMFSYFTIIISIFYLFTLIHKKLYIFPFIILFLVSLSSASFLLQLREIRLGNFVDNYRIILAIHAVIGVIAVINIIYNYRKINNAGK